MAKRPTIGSKAIKPKAYPLMREAVEAGAAYAWRSRVFKYADEPTDQYAIDTITECVMGEIADRFDFDTHGGE